MRLKILIATLMVATVFLGTIFTPVTAIAQDRRDKESKHRQQKKNEWRNIAIGSGALSLYGLIKHDNTLTFAGAAGALYSANRYEQDRKSQSKTDRARASYFGKTHFDRDGHRYVRKTVWKHGKKYYQFVRK
jgi:hypothetical protein